VRSGDGHDQAAEGATRANAWRLRVAVAGLLAALCVAAVAGCGGGGDSTAADGKPTTLHATFAAFPDALDPAMAYTLEGLTSIWDSYLPLLTYQHKSGPAGTKLIPALARALPKITDGGRTYTLYLRKGLRFSDGSPVLASDFGATIERTLAMNSPGTAFYTDIVGAEEFAKTKKGHIGGIEADDKSGRIVIHLVEPRSTFANELAMPFAAPLPAGTKREDLTKAPPPATGPYEIVASKPGASWSYARNPEWAKANGPRIPSVPAGHYDAIDMNVIANPETAVNEVIRGKLDWMEEPPPPDRYAELRKRYEGTQLLITPQIDVYYFWMNPNMPPFEDLKVRQAVNYALEPGALERIYGGQLRAVQQVLPPDMPGHVAYRPYPHDMAKARELMAEAKLKSRKVTVWTDDYGPNKQAGEYYEGVLRELGLEPTLKVIPAANYFTLIGNSSIPELDTGWAAWFIDYPHPNDYFQPQLSKDGITPTAANNYARFNDPAIDRKIAQLDREPLGPKQEAAYAKLDREVMAQAPWAPFGSLTMSTFVGPDIDLEKLVVSPVYGQDLTSFAPR
jgi:peptide/nickel transport system substrate-binding protein